MTAAGFEASPLWRRTLGAVDGEGGARLRQSYLTTRKNAAVLLGELSHSTPDFTVHDITHVDALWETAHMLCGTAVPLTPAEAYVLGCAFVLHDAAMGAAAHKETVPEALGLPRWHDLLATYIVRETGSWPTAAELAAPGEDVTRACLVHAIRELHAAHAATLVDQSWRTSAGNELHLIDDLQLRESYGPLIGELAASHWWPVDRLPGAFGRVRGSLPWLPVEWTVNPLKLACLLRLADATQIDGRRAPSFLYALRRPEGNSREHWRFQEHMSRPRLVGDRVTYDAWRPFDAADADAWWLALDYLRSVDAELKKVDALLHDLDKPRFAGRAVAGVDTPERFAEHFPVRGWRPVDARIAISDAPHLVEVLGGEQLYGKAPEVGLRELLQNAQDAVTARKTLDPGCGDSEILVELTEDDGVWTLTVTDQGVGMDEDILTGALLDFGRSGWSSDVVRGRFVGLADGGFRPKGRFGIGFYSVFILGDDVEVTTRRFDTGQADARRLRFRGVRQRPMLTPVSPEERIPVGTTIRVVLTTEPRAARGLLSLAHDDELGQLVRHVCLQRAIPIRANEPRYDRSELIELAELATATPEEVFDLLYPAWKSERYFPESQRLLRRTEFAALATEITDLRGRRIGLATLGENLSFSGSRTLPGTVVVDGFRADTHLTFTGYVLGLPSRASRDQVELMARAPAIRDWLIAQEDRLREVGRFGPTPQVLFAHLLYRATGGVRDDHSIAFAGEELMTVGQVREWARDRGTITLCESWPLSMQLRPVRLVRQPDYAPASLPDDWILPSLSYGQPPFITVFEARRDMRFSASPVGSWQKFWWHSADSVRGIVLTTICAAWECDIGDVLAPVAERGWNDYADLGDGLDPVPVYRLERPTTTAG